MLKTSSASNFTCLQAAEQNVDQNKIIDRCHRMFIFINIHELTGVRVGSPQVGAPASYPAAIDCLCV